MFRHSVDTPPLGCKLPPPTNSKKAMLNVNFKTNKYNRPIVVSKIIKEESKYRPCNAKRAPLNCKQVA
jgi:hypothetical protein